MNVEEFLSDKHQVIFIRNEDVDFVEGNDGAYRTVIKYDRVIGFVGEYRGLTIGFVSNIDDYGRNEILIVHIGTGVVIDSVDMLPLILMARSLGSKGETVSLYKIVSEVAKLLPNVMPKSKVQQIKQEMAATFPSEKAPAHHDLTDEEEVEIMRELNERRKKNG